MSISEAVEILDNHNKWRRDQNVPYEVPPVDPKELGIAMDTIIEYFE